MRLREALEIVLQIADDNIEQEETDRYMPEAEREEMTKGRQDAIEMVRETTLDLYDAAKRVMEHIQATGRCPEHSEAYKGLIKILAKAGG